MLSPCDARWSQEPDVHGFRTLQLQAAALQDVHDGRNLEIDAGRGLGVRVPQNLGGPQQFVQILRMSGEVIFELRQ